MEKLIKIYICPKCKKHRWKTLSHQQGHQCRWCGYAKWNLKK